MPDDWVCKGMKISDHHILQLLFQPREYRSVSFLHLNTSGFIPALENMPLRQHESFIQLQQFGWTHGLRCCQTDSPVFIRHRFTTLNWTRLPNTNHLVNIYTRAVEKFPSVRDATCGTRVEKIESKLCRHAAAHPRRLNRQGNSFWWSGDLLPCPGSNILQAHRPFRRVLWSF